jgi:hypothetical protein
MADRTKGHQIIPRTIGRILIQVGHRQQIATEFVFPDSLSQLPKGLLWPLALATTMLTAPVGLFLDTKGDLIPVSGVAGFNHWHG